MSFYRNERKMIDTREAGTFCLGHHTVGESKLHKKQQPTTVCSLPDRCISPKHDVGRLHQDVTSSASRNAMHCPRPLLCTAWACKGWVGYLAALTCCSDGTHLRRDSGPRGPAPANVTAALHLGDGLRQLVGAAAIGQSCVTVSRADIWEAEKHIGTR